MALHSQTVYKLKGFLYQFLSSSSMGGIGAFGRFINAPGDFISFGRNFIGWIALSIYFVFKKGAFDKILAGDAVLGSVPRIAVRSVRYFNAVHDFGERVVSYLHWANLLDGFGSSVPEGIP